MPDNVPPRSLVIYLWFSPIVLFGRIVLLVAHIQSASFQHQLSDTNMQLTFIKVKYEYGTTLA